MKKKSIIIMSTLVSVLLLAGCSKNKTEQSAQSQPTEPATTESSSVPTSTSATNTSESSPAATSNDIDLIIQPYKDKYPDTTITSVEYEKDLGKFYYEIKGVDDDTEYKVKIDSETNKIVNDKTERLDLDEQGGKKRESDALMLENIKSVDDILAIAEKEVPGSELISWELDTDVGVTYFKVTVVANNQETELKIDAQSAKILEKELDD